MTNNIDKDLVYRILKYGKTAAKFPGLCKQKAIEEAMKRMGAPGPGQIKNHTPTKEELQKIEELLMRESDPVVKDAWERYLAILKLRRE